MIIFDIKNTLFKDILNKLILLLRTSEEKISDKRLNDLENGKEKLIPADEVFKELGL